MNLKDYPEVARLVPEKKPYPFMSSPDENLSAAEVKGHNSAVDLLTPLLELEVGIDKELFNQIEIAYHAIRSFASYGRNGVELTTSGITDTHLNRAFKALEQANKLLASSNVIEIKRKE